MTQWTQADIAKLAKDFYAGVPLKIMGHTMDRSPSALNKALARFGIRAPKTHHASVHNDFRDKKQHACDIKKKQLLLKRKKLYQKKKENLWRDCAESAKTTIGALQLFHDAYIKAVDSKNVRKWVTMKNVINDLREKGHVVFPVHCVKAHQKIDGNSLYFLDKEKLTAIEIIMKLNAYREKNGFAPVYVQGITL